MTNERISFRTFMLIKSMLADIIENQDVIYRSIDEQTASLIGDEINETVNYSYQIIDKLASLTDGMPEVRQ